MLDHTLRERALSLLGQNDLLLRFFGLLFVALFDQIFLGLDRHIALANLGGHLLDLKALLLFDVVLENFGFLENGIDGRCFWLLNLIRLESIGTLRGALCVENFEFFMLF